MTDENDDVTEDDLGTEYWATSDDVQDEFELSVQGEAPSHRTRIEKATRMVQADWSDITGGTIPDDLPDITDDENGLLRDATAYLAASLAHLKYAQNVSGDNNDDDRHIFLENMADKAFDRWTSVAEVKPDDSQETSGSSVGGLSGTISGLNPIERDLDDRRGRF